MKAVDLFCGAGGMSVGATAAGIEVVQAFDNWAPAIETYTANHTHEATWADLSDPDEVFKQITSEKVDLVFGGPPCQDFSHAGRREEGDRAELTLSFARLVQLIRPTYFVMENVARAAQSNAFQQARETLRSTGYQIAEITLDAAYFGVPQHRRRLIVIGTLKNDLHKIESDLKSRHQVLPTNVRDEFTDLGIGHYYRHPRSYSRRAVFSTAEPSPTIRGINRPRPASYVPHDSDTSSDTGIRALTYPERARIQTFKSSYEWKGTSSEIEQMIGNSVPPRLAEVIFESLTGTASSEGTPKQEAFERWLSGTKKLSRTRIKQTISKLRSEHREHSKYGETYDIHHAADSSTSNENQMLTTSALANAPSALYLEYIQTLSHDG